MAHPQQLQFIKTVSSNLTESYKNISILEIGSYDVNGSIRNFFPDSNYVGVDLTEGPGVDLVIVSAFARFAAQDALVVCRAARALQAGGDAQRKHGAQGLCLRHLGRLLRAQRHTRTRGAGTAQGLERSGQRPGGAQRTGSTGHDRAAPAVAGGGGQGLCRQHRQVPGHCQVQRRAASRSNYGIITVKGQNYSDVEKATTVRTITM